MNRSGEILNYIYVKDLKRPDKHELDTLGNHLRLIEKRASGKYLTFISIPIRAGMLNLDSNDIVLRPALGIIGFDLKDAYGFGNFDDRELHIICCLVDLISIPVYDLIELK